MRGGKRIVGSRGYRGSFRYIFPVRKLAIDRKEDHRPKCHRPLGRRIVLGTLEQFGLTILTCTSRLVLQVSVTFGLAPLPRLLGTMGKGTDKEHSQ